MLVDHTYFFLSLNNQFAEVLFHFFQCFTFLVMHINPILLIIVNRGRQYCDKHGISYYIFLKLLTSTLKFLQHSANLLVPNNSLIITFYKFNYTFECRIVIIQSRYFQKHQIFGKHILKKKCFLLHCRTIETPALSIDGSMTLQEFLGNCFTVQYHNCQYVKNANFSEAFSLHFL